MAVFGMRGGHFPATSHDDPRVMKRNRRNENSQIRQSAGEWAGPWTAYPAAVAFLFGATGGTTHTAVHDFRPEDRDAW